ncbi:5069_t:CDS:2 [Diversispora eburnea]|uniref:5069_t:CDS:1 n=1 Tax=Diversispora eburnea TaxID=1213867 RepID=A0A9N9FB48_9GLOM|nr:5069_t:CDS:2 [Diversispora eburnea]
MTNLKEGNPSAYYIIARKVVGLATVCLIIQLSFEGLFLGTLFRVDCTNSDFTECKTKIDLELQSNGLSNTAPSCAAMALGVVALSGIMMLLENRYQLMPNDQQPLIRFSQGWNFAGMIVIMQNLQTYKLTINYALEGTFCDVTWYNGTGKNQIGEDYPG